jgi:hypothetical protein
VPREYQIAKNNPYLLPHNLYMRVLYTIRDYDRVRGEYDALLHGSPPKLAERAPGGGSARPAEDKAVRLAAMSGEIHAVEQALMAVPEEYRRGLMDNICHGAPYPDTAHYNTWRYWRYRFAWHVAKRLKLI